MRRVALATFRRVTLMLMLPVIASSFLLSFIRGIELFESPLFFGTPAGITVFTTELYNAINHRANARLPVCDGAELRRSWASCFYWWCGSGGFARP